MHARDPAAQLSRLLRGETAEKALLHEITAAARRGALSGLLIMYETLRDGALIFVDDALPIASEAMEDTDPAVREVITPDSNTSEVALYSCNLSCAVRAFRHDRNAGCAAHYS